MKNVMNSYILSRSASTVIRKRQRLAGLNNRNLLLPVLEAEKSKIRVVPDEISLPDLQTAAFPPCPHTVREKGLWSLSLLIRTLTAPKRASGS